MGSGQNSAMLVTASTDIRFHGWPLNGIEEKKYEPSGSENSIIQYLSLSNDNKYITFVTKDGRAEIVAAAGEELRKVQEISAMTEITAITFQVRLTSVIVYFYFLRDT